ncbi:hypothetical protein WL26_23905 [Burkholderia cepacia]|nr:hypothetical protein WL26_23905 [Burkholderia cepacia]
MSQLFEKGVRVGFLRRIGLRPRECGLQVTLGLRRMQPRFVFGDHDGGAHEPHPWLALFDEHLPAGEFLAKRNLTARTDDLDTGLVFRRVHGRFRPN